MSIRNAFEKGKLFTEYVEVKLDQNNYEAHKIFKGVSIKTLVSGISTDNKISCHIVKIEAHHSLEFHKHIPNMEIHEVIQGSGICYINEVSTIYNPGTIGIIPKDTLHKVKALDEDLYILAKFLPALL